MILISWAESVRHLENDFVGLSSSVAHVLSLLGWKPAPFGNTIWWCLLVERPIVCSMVSKYWKQILSVCSRTSKGIIVVDADFSKDKFNLMQETIIGQISSRW
ncbi:hypothetical protein RvY_11201-2 [Ramazzottius varieornatus]|uniref:Uncharacterized protein n=1 Tax=Ramazzottius varieornatus TaxID=947166 RepID=A0A1D1VFC1_RAMVA|nr:hypothetical protein RvY_11201-2 [Ramazzottius varieornatus]